MYFIKDEDELVGKNIAYTFLNGDMIIVTEDKGIVILDPERDDDEDDLYIKICSPDEAKRRLLAHIENLFKKGIFTAEDVKAYEEERKEGARHSRQIQNAVKYKEPLAK